MRPHIYRTRDSGRTWKEIVNGLPNDPINSVLTAANMPFIRTQDVAAAAALYATITGRVSSVNTITEIAPAPMTTTHLNASASDRSGLCIQQFYRAARECKPWCTR